MENNIPQPNNHYQSAFDKEKNSRPLFIKVVIILIIATVLFTVYYFYRKHQEARIYSEQEVLQQLLGKITEINSASYDWNFSIKLTERDPGTKPLSNAFPDYKENMLPYERDRERFLDLRSIFSSLNTHNNLSKRYPYSLDQANVIIKDPLGQSYGYFLTDNNTNFNLIITFETVEAIEIIESSYSSPFLSSDNIPKISGKTVTFDKNSRSSYSTYNLKLKRPGFIEFFSEITENQEQIFSRFLYGDFNFNFFLSGANHFKARDSGDLRLSVGGEMNMEGMTIRGGAELLRKNNTYYVKIKEIPMLYTSFFYSSSDAFSGVSRVREKWIKISAEEFDSTSFREMIDTIENETEKESPLKMIKTVYAVAIGQSALNVDSVKREIINDKEVYAYKFSLNKDKMDMFYGKVIEELNKELEESKKINLNEDTSDYLRSEEFATFLDYFNKNIEFYLYADPKTGYPVKISYSIRLVPEDNIPLAENKQVVISASLSLDDINKKVIVKEPKDFITYEDATILVTGMSREEYRLEQQLDRIKRIRGALRDYKLVTGNFPASLDNLKMTGNEAMKFEGVKEEIYGGIGIALDKRANGEVYISSVVYNGPAQKAGLMRGDVIIKINNTFVQSLTLDQATNMIRGPKGTTVNITISRDVSGLPIKPLVSQDFTVTREDISVYDFSTRYTKERYENRPFLTRIPNDFYTGKPYRYSGSGDDYNLIYKVELPPYERGKMPLSILYTLDRSYGPSSPIRYKYRFNYLEGDNTADSKLISKEADYQSGIDSDQDGLPDVFEDYLGTDKYKKDTDGDGRSDAEELYMRTDPLGPGRLESDSRDYYFY